MSLMQNRDPAVEIALVLKLEILDVEHSEVFPLHLHEAPFPHCDNPSLGSPRDAMR